MSADDEDYKPNGRPQSAIAQNFSASLNETFAIHNNPDLAGLLQSVEQKKQAVTTQSQELEALEAKLRETEARLNQKTMLSKTVPSAEKTSSARRKPVASTFGGQENDRLPAGSGSPSATQSSPAANPAPSQGYARWEGLMPRGNEQRSR